MARELTVGQVARRAGVTVSALHFYETRGLIRSRRTAGNQRRYAGDVLRRVAVIKIAQEVGISLADIAAALDSLPEGRTPTRDDWNLLSTAWRDDLDRRISQLKKLRDGLTDCIGCGCMSIDRCPLRNRNDRLARQGPGARRLALPSPRSRGEGGSKGRMRDSANDQRTSATVPPLTCLPASSPGKRGEET